MNDLPDGSRRLFSGGQGDLAARVDGLGRAAEAARGRLAEDVVTDAAAVADRAQARLRLSAEHTIVALAGATGSGKSSLFNQLTELDLAGVGVRRPTTSWALACAWGPEGASQILEWIGIPARHQVSRMSMLDSGSDETSLHGLVLLDLPDHDSTEVAHHLEVDRLVTFADLLVWVLDPQKYADAAVHDRYLRPLASHADVTMVVLNQIDTIPVAGRDAALADVRRLLDEDGLADIPLLGASATTGEGADDLRRVLAKRIRDKAAAKERLHADLTVVAERLASVSGTSPAAGLTESDRDDLGNLLADCAGVPVVVDAIERSTARRAARVTGWPPARWWGRLRSDPLHRVEVETDLSVAALARSSVPEPTKVQQASVDIAVRDLTEKAANGLSEPWARAVRAASQSRAAELTDALDQAVLGTDLQVSRTPWWWRLVGVVQWLLLAAAAVGLVWLVGLAVLSFVDASTPVVPDVLGVPLPTLLLGAGVVLGIVLALGCRIAGRSSGRQKAQRADRLLREAIEGVADDQVLHPLRRELETYEACRAGLLAALDAR